MRYGIWCNLKNMKTPMEDWMFFTFFKLHKWNQIAQSIAYVNDLTSKVKTIC